MDIMPTVKIIEKEIIQLRRHIHQNPELSFQEFKTAQLIEDYLRKLPSFKVIRLGKTGVIGILKGKLSAPKKTLALRADIDALPIQEKTSLPFSSKNEGVMHGCGHDIHTSILLGTAKILSNLADKFSGTVKFIFQPGEEKAAGAQQLIKLGVLLNPDVDAIIALHCWPEIPAGTVGVKRGTMLAATDLLNLKIIGESGHAAHPNDCVDPIYISSQIVIAIQEIISRELSPNESAVISFGQINGGTASNIIPGEVVLSGTVRTLNLTTRNSMPERIKRISDSIAKAFRGKARVEYFFTCSPIIPDESLIKNMEKAVKQTIGKDNLIYLKNPSMGSDDFSHYLDRVPGLFFRVGTQNAKEPFYPLHSPYFNADEKSIGTGISVMVATVIEYFLS